MAVWGIVGDMGCGKTILSTYFGYELYSDGYTVYSNYNLKYPYTPIDSLKDIGDLQTYPNIILLDEAWITADSRKSGSYRNLVLSKQVLQSRKQIADVIYTTQFANQIDLRIRQITKLFLIPEIIYTDDDGIPAIIRAEFFESLSNFKFKEKGAKIYDIYNTHLLYDTNQRIEETDSGEYVDLLDKYKDFRGTKADLICILTIEDGIPKSQAALAAQYIIYKNIRRLKGLDTDIRKIAGLSKDEGTIIQESKVDNAKEQRKIRKELFTPNSFDLPSIKYANALIS